MCRLKMTKIRNELEDVKTKVVELENDIDNQSSLLESTTNALKHSDKKLVQVLLLASHYQVKIIITICIFFGFFFGLFYLQVTFFLP